VGNEGDIQRSYRGAIVSCIVTLLVMLEGKVEAPRAWQWSATLNGEPARGEGLRHGQPSKSTRKAMSPASVVLAWFWGWDLLPPACQYPAPDFPRSIRVSTAFAGVVGLRFSSRDVTWVRNRQSAKSTVSQGSKARENRTCAPGQFGPHSTPVPTASLTAGVRSGPMK
jgi:hypothetical protein